MYTLVVLSCMLSGFGACRSDGGVTVVNVPGFASQQLCLTAGNELTAHLEREYQKVIASRCLRVRDDG